MLNFILCDDNPRLNSALHLRLEKIAKTHQLEMKIALQATDPREVLRYAQNNREDNNVYLLDIDLKNELDGMTLAKQIRETNQFSYIIFITAHQEYVLQSFKIKTFDFLLKPLPYVILEECILSLYKDFRARGKIHQEPLIPFKSGATVYFVKVSELVFLEKYRQILVAHTLNGQIRCYGSLEEMQQKLEPLGFFRCHKSYLINTKLIANISINENCVQMINGEKCFVSRNYKKGLLSYVSGNL